LFEPLYADGDSCAGLIGPVLVFVARGRPAAIQVKLMNEWGERLRREYPQGAGFVVIVRSDAPVPTEQERVYMRGCFEACEGFARAVGMVIEGEGFVAATLRAAATAVTLVMRMPMPFKIFGNVEGAAYFVLNKLPLETRPTPHRLVTGITALRREHERGTLKIPSSRSA
jgi:hypothetical protein